MNSGTVFAGTERFATMSSGTRAMPATDAMSRLKLKLSFSQPFLKSGFAISLDRIDGAFRFANATVDAFLGMDDKHVLALVEAVHGANLDAVHGFAANATIVDDVGSVRRPSRRLQRLPLAENGRTEDL